MANGANQNGHAYDTPGDLSGLGAWVGDRNQGRRLSAEEAEVFRPRGLGTSYYNTQRNIVTTTRSQMSPMMERFLRESTHQEPYRRAVQVVSTGSLRSSNSGSGSGSGTGSGTAVSGGTFSAATTIASNLNGASKLSETTDSALVQAAGATVTRPEDVRQRTTSSSATRSSTVAPSE